MYENAFFGTCMWLQLYYGDSLCLFTTIQGIQVYVYISTAIVIAGVALIRTKSGSTCTRERKFTSS